MAKSKATKATDNYQLWKVFTPDWTNNNIMQVEITCPKCKQATTRAACECKLAFYDDVTYKNYYCECGHFLRCDAISVKLKPQIRDVTDVTFDDESDSVQNLRDML